jgi:hypothetical protein
MGVVLMQSYKRMSGAVAAVIVGVGVLGNVRPVAAAPISTGLQLWYSADSGVFNDTGGGTAATNGATVGLWQDQASSAGQGGTQNASQSTSTKAATFVASNSAFNNQATLHFNSSTTASSPTAFMPTSTPLNGSFTIFVVASVGNNTVASSLVSNARPTSMSGGQWVFMTESGGLTFRSNGVSNATAAGVIANSTFIATAWSPATGEVDVSLNGGNAGVNTNQNTTQFAGAANIGIGGVDPGANTPARSMNGDIAEVLVYNTSLSAADRQTTLNYLASKYAVTVAPEPATLGLFGVAALGLLARRRKA